ncbi:MAG: hypothetical protein KatS3mg043_1540 [Rhodothermaceae bacterium]|nr:MAG: hypothetical protein KatS3mg043_1540 [Rhodothermaceae bacterium]
MLQDDNIAEAHEGMMLRFENVVVTTPNADAGIGRDFGEFAFSSDGTTENQVRSDDQSPLVPGGSSMFNGGERLAFIQGLWTYTFGNYKLMPEDANTDIGPVTNVATEDEPLPARYALHQNFPNPFNLQTTIRYELARTGRVSLEVFDLLGRRIATLVNGEQPAGSFTVTFDARDLASGMYVYRLTAGSQVMTRTMLLMK